MFISKFDVVVEIIFGEIVVKLSCKVCVDGGYLPVRVGGKRVLVPVQEFCPALPMQFFPM